MKTSTSPIQAVMNEYVAWGGPIVTRAVAYADMKDRGFDARAIDISVFGRQSVPAPMDPAAHLDFFRRIQAMEAGSRAGRRMNALTICNGCEVNDADPDSAAGYCTECEAEARGQTEDAA